MGIAKKKHHFISRFYLEGFVDRDNPRTYGSMTRRLSRKPAQKIHPAMLERQQIADVGALQGATGIEEWREADGELGDSSWLTAHEKTKRGITRPKAATM
jgi:hypothetical protein